ncbi:MAG: hypothetical protein ABSB71_08415 [Candidatus Bathyarchaeia archaeon]|jgi:Na+/citrate or Na+/malate symporter
MAQSKDIWRKIVVLAVVGGLAFWATSIATSLLPIAADYRVARWSAQTVWVGSLPAGMIIGFFVSFFLLRFFDKIPTKNPILKALILSFVAVVVIEVLSTFGNLRNAYVYLFVDTVMNIPRFLALGIVIGYLYKRLYGSESLGKSDKH